MIVIALAPAVRRRRRGGAQCMPTYPSCRRQGRESRQEIVAVAAFL